MLTRRKIMLGALATAGLSPAAAIFSDTSKAAQQAMLDDSIIIYRLRCSQAYLFADDLEYFMNKITTSMMIPSSLLTR